MVAPNPLVAHRATKLPTRGIKSYASSTLTLGVKGGQQVPLSVLIGANASGKTNLIEGLRLLSAIAAGTGLDTIRSGSTAWPEGRPA